MTTRYPNLNGWLRTREELREEYLELTRLHGQQCLAYGDPNHPNVLATNRDLDRARDALRRAEAEGRTK